MPARFTHTCSNHTINPFQSAITCSKLTTETLEKGMKQTHYQNSLAAAEAEMEHLSNDYEDHPNQHENSHKLCNETGHPIVNLMGSQ